jgi:hypothetical protein
MDITNRLVLFCNYVDHISFCQVTPRTFNNIGVLFLLRLVCRCGVALYLPAPGEGRKLLELIPNGVVCVLIPVSPLVTIFLAATCA